MPAVTEPPTQPVSNPPTATTVPEPTEAPTEVAATPTEAAPKAQEVVVEALVVRVNLGAALVAHAAFLIQENSRDLAAARETALSRAMIDRLALTQTTVESIATSSSTTTSSSSA